MIPYYSIIDVCGQRPQPVVRAAAADNTWAPAPPDRDLPGVEADWRSALMGAASFALSGPL